MSTDSTISKPATPRSTPMQALSGLFRTPTRLRTPTTVSRRNKRAHGRMSLSSTPSSTPNTPSHPAVVLQTYSLSTDSIVLTALPCVPFCCHEDLLTMSRTQLEGVVRALNVRLPRRMRISPEDDFWQNDDQEHTRESDGDDDDGLSRMSEAEMRKRIEELVGIRAVVGKNRVPRSGLGLDTRTRVPPTPKAVRTRDAEWRPYEKTPWEMEVDADPAVDQSDDSSVMVEDALISPLASRTKSVAHSRRRSGMLSRLAILQEESEECESKEDDSEDNETRPSKRQRVSSGSVAQQSEEGSYIVQEGRGSRLIENMDLSGSPLLVGEDDGLSDSVIESDERGVTTARSPADCVKTSKEDVEVPLQRKRSARIQEIALKRASSADTDRKTTSETRNSKSSILRSNSLSSRCPPRNTSITTGTFDAERKSGIPREFTIRLPFTSTPPHQKPDDSPAWSAPRILRSHSQRLLKPSKFIKTKGTLRRSQSEKYPRATDLAFVTIDRPRYRFIRRKSKVNKVANGDQEFHRSISASPVRASCHQSGVEHLDGKHKYDKGSEDLKVVNGNPTTGGLHNLPSTLRSFLTPRSRAPSTSTVASTRENVNDSPVQTIVRGGAAPTAFADSAVSDGATERVWEALERMAVDPQ